MSSRGQIVPELAELLQEIAKRLEEGTAELSHAEALRRVAKVAADEDKRFVLMVHRRRGRPPWGERGVDRRLAMARAVKGYMDEHQCSNEAAREALNGTFGNTGPETLGKAWQDMGPLLEMSDERRELLLYFKRLEARGLAKVSRVKR